MVNEFNIKYKDDDYCASALEVLEEGNGWKVFSYSGNMNELSKAKNGEKLYSWMWGYGEWVHDEPEEVGEYSLAHWQCSDYHLLSTNGKVSMPAEIYEGLFWCTGNHSEVYGPLGWAVSFTVDSSEEFYMFFKDYGIVVTSKDCEKGWNKKCYDALRRVLGLE